MELEDLVQFGKRCLALLSDEAFDSLMYFLKTRKRLNLVDPQTYTEKLLYIKRNDHNPLMTLCADKYHVTEYLKQCGLESIQKEVYRVYSSPYEVDLSKLPERFFLKCNHGSRGNYLMDGNAAKKLSSIQKELALIMGRDYYWQSREWAYKGIKPCVICEEALLDSQGNLPVDYKFYCFHGRVEYFMVSVGEYEHHARNHKFGKDCKSVDYMFKAQTTLPESQVAIPDNIDDMVAISERLAQPFRHVRVDLYDVDGRIVFGELTFYSNGGFVCIPNENTELALGKLLSIDGLRRRTGRNG